MDIDYIIRSGKRPFILGADFNNKPEEWQNNPIPWLKRWDASIITGDNCGHTGIRGDRTANEVSPNDYLNISNSLVSIHICFH